MCGIVASVSSLVDIDPGTVRQMTNVGKHRGPDGMGVLSTSENAFLRDRDELSWIAVGHSRLSIIDPSSVSDQPLVSRCGRFALVFNGEIYNYLELRSELASLGHVFVSTGDTEVLLAALMKWHVDALHRLRGMFSFIFVDRERERVLIARDRYGIKPLYIWRTGNQIHFASEVKQFTAHPQWKARLNERAALEFLLYGITDYSERTMFSDVQHVLPGTFIEIEKSLDLRLSSSRWWNPRRSRFQGSYTDAVEQYRHLLEESIRLHLRSDVPVASCLSGGLDSSAIVGWASRSTTERGAPLRTYTASSEDVRLDETRFARMVNEHTGSHGTEVRPTSDVLWTEIDQLVWQQDEPFGSTSIFAQWLVFSSMREDGMKVALDGQGADEQLAGYDSFLPLFVLNQLMKGRVTAGIDSYSKFRASNRLSLQTLASTGAYRFMPRYVRETIGRTLGLASHNAMGWLSETAIRDAEVCDPFISLDGAPKTVRDLRIDMVDRSNLPMLLRFEDRNSMRHGVEARVPFVDHVLMEFGLSLPDEYVLRAGSTKSVLRDVAADVLPDQVARRTDKLGFQTSEHGWFKQQRERFLSELDDADPFMGHLFTDSTRAMVDRSISGEVSYLVAWRVFCLLRWMKVFGVEAA